MALELRSGKQVQAVSQRGFAEAIPLVGDKDTRYCRSSGKGTRPGRDSPSQLSLAGLSRLFSPNSWKSMLELSMLLSIGEQHRRD